LPVPFFIGFGKNSTIINTSFCQYMKGIQLALLMALVFMLSSCYQAQITTDKQPSKKVIEIEWAHGFVYGFVPPKEVRASEECDHGIAKVETEVSALNFLARYFTSGIYTPMTIEVTCAAGNNVVEAATNEKRQASATK